MEPAIASRFSSLRSARAAAARCRNCPLWKNATRTVFGEGPASAEIVIVGEQPGNDEDLAGRPFVGPAGKLLDRALAEAGLDRTSVWVTNAVKHFKWKPRGKFRLHQKPSAGEIDACRPWLIEELSHLSPRVVILLGATAARSLLGKPVKVTANRGVLGPSELADKIILTVHPSYLLRIRGEEDRHKEYRRFVDDLRLTGA